MDFDDAARLDTSRVSTSRGGRGRGAAIGGGGLGLVGLILAVLLGVNPADLTGGRDGGTGFAEDTAVTTSDLGSRCRTGADADRDEQCRVVAIDNSLTDYWASAVQGFRPATTRIFAGTVATGCGQATSAVGPFYCPPDEGIFLDLGFFDELRTTYGAQGGDFAQAYVPEGLSAAAAVGDDRIQEKTAGRVDPESWTHGSADQRQKWFRTGLRSGDPAACDTFRTARV